uniref:Glycosylated integral membrane protein 1 n=1 Tax=Corvus moneduloides TaxID=1196302 RepID=A0A8C3DUE3_CORMO
MEAVLGRRELLPLSLLLPPLAAALLGPAAPLGQEAIRVGVTMLNTSGEFHKGQVLFNITYVNGQVYLNDFPMKSGVAHITCQTVILENGSLDNLPDQQRLGTVSVRIMVHEWPLASTSDLHRIVIQEEVTEIDGKQGEGPCLFSIFSDMVQQEEVTEIDILVKDLRVLRHSNYTVPLKESMLYSMPRDNDVLFTLPNLSGKDIQDPLQTTSQYLIQQVETTVDEETLPGKLPETPLRIEPPSSYKVMCQWVEDLRKGLCRFWFQSLPILFSFMEVVVVGVVGAALIIKVLKVILPSCENKGILFLDQVSFVPVTAISLPSELSDRKNNLDEKACT